MVPLGAWFMGYSIEYRFQFAEKFDSIRLQKSTPRYAA
jgi:hypothetical protein